MNIKSFRWVSLAITLTIFGAVDLVVTLIVPGIVPEKHLGPLMIPPIVAAVSVVCSFPYAIALFERQQDRIERQVRELETLHAMDTAIVSEMEIDRVLDVAVQRVMRAVDAVAGGVVLIDPANNAPQVEIFMTPDHSGEDASRFHEIIRSAGRPDLRWEAIIFPLRDAADQVFGHIGAARYRPTRPFTDADRALCQALAGTVVVALTNANALFAARETARVIAEAERARADAAQVRIDLQRERRIAEVLTKSLLPDIPAQIGLWSFSKRYEAQSDEAQVGGDIYDLFPLSEGRWGIVIADVSGKGLAAAQKTAMVKYSLRSYAREHADPAQVLASLNDTLSDEDEMTGFVTLFYGVLDENAGRLVYASAGHEPPLLMRSDGGFEALAPTGMVLGAQRDMPYENAEVEFEQGDGLLLYTDGLTEARSEVGGVFLELAGVEAFMANLIDIQPESVADRLYERVTDYTGTHQRDDLALLWIQYSGKMRSESRVPTN